MTNQNSNEIYDYVAAQVCLHQGLQQNTLYQNPGVILTNAGNETLKNKQNAPYQNSGVILTNAGNETLENEQKSKSNRFSFRYVPVNINKISKLNLNNRDIRLFLELGTRQRSKITLYAAQSNISLSNQEIVCEAIYYFTDLNSETIARCIFAKHLATNLYCDAKDNNFPYKIFVNLGRTVSKKTSSEYYMLKIRATFRFDSHPVFGYLYKIPPLSKETQDALGLSDSLPISEATVTND